MARKFKNGDMVYVNRFDICCLGHVVDCKEYRNFRPDYLIKNVDGGSVWVDQKDIRIAEEEEDIDVCDISAII